MRVSLKGKLTALIAVLVLVVVVVISTIYLSSLVRLSLATVHNRGEYVALETYHQAQTALVGARMPATVDPNNPQDVRKFVQETLAADPGLNSIIESAVGYSSVVYYVCITDPQGTVMVHNDPEEIGTKLASAEQFHKLMSAGLVSQLRVIYGPPQVYEEVFPLDLRGGQPLGDVRVGLSTVFLSNQLTPELRNAGRLSGLAILLATFIAGVLSFSLLRPLETISQSVDRLARGETPEELQSQRADEWGILSSKLNLLGEQMRGEKAAFVALKDNLDRLLANLNDGLLLFDQEDRLVMATPVVTRFLGRTPQVQQRAEEIFAGEKPLDRLLREAFHRHESFAWRVVEMAGESSTTRVAVSTQFVHSQQARVATLVNLRDASTRAELQDQIDLAARLTAYAKLTSGVAHEVKNPLNAMVLQVEILKAKLGEQRENVRPQLDTLSHEIRRLDRVVKTFLDFTRPVELRPTPTDLERVIREVFTLAEPQAGQNKVRLVLNGNGALPAVKVDRDLIKQALLNLVLNGCQAMPSGGELSVTPRTKNNALEIEIRDQGTGIPPELRPRLFSLFFTTKPGGTGVGLAMAYRIIQLHNGTIDFTSEVNRGTTFLISLPR